MSSILCRILRDSGLYHTLLLRFTFKDAAAAFKVTRTGKSEDGKGVVKAVISGPDVSVDDI